MKKLLASFLLLVSVAVFAQPTNGTLTVTFTRSPVNQGQVPFFGLNNKVYSWVGTPALITDMTLGTTTNVCATNLFNMLGSNFPTSVKWSSSNWLTPASFNFVAASNTIVPLLSGNYANVTVSYPALLSTNTATWGVYGNLSVTGGSFGHSKTNNGNYSATSTDDWITISSTTNATLTLPNSPQLKLNFIFTPGGTNLTLQCVGGTITYNTAKLAASTTVSTNILYYARADGSGTNWFIGGH